jgi:hypothetical protein
MFYKFSLNVFNQLVLKEEQTVRSGGILSQQGDSNGWPEGTQPRGGRKGDRKWPKKVPRVQKLVTTTVLLPKRTHCDYFL